MKYWSKEEDEFIINNYINMSFKEISVILDRTYRSVEGRIRKLKLKNKSDIIIPKNIVNGKDIRHTMIGSVKRAQSRYYMIKYRLEHTDEPKNRGYKNKKLLVSEKDFVEWFMPQDYKGCSVDRIDNSGHYELSNMQIIPIDENIRKDKVKAKGGMCECYVCKQTKSLDLFAVDKRRKNGHTTICKSCDNKRKYKKV